MHGSKGIEGLIVGGSFIAFATVTVVLRLISRRMMKNALEVDDYMIVVALVGKNLLLERQMQLIISINRYLPMGVFSATLLVSHEIHC